MHPCCALSVSSLAFCKALAHRRGKLFPALLEERAMECTSPSGIVEVSLSVPAELFLACVRKHGISDYTPGRALSITYMQKPKFWIFSPIMDPRPRIYWKSSFCNRKSTCVSLSEASKYSMSNYEANKNTDREAHPAINFKRQSTN